ncbi:AEC family transporter [candidate division KSB1 bacterium]|nr:AEC family transporter [candidate division KSB1 bacterium]
MHEFLFILESVAPVFLITFLGMVLKRVHMINDQFVADSSKLVFNVAMPVLVFLKLSEVNFGQVFQIRQILYLYFATFTAVVIIWLSVLRLIPQGEDRGAFIQGAVRSNFAIVGFAIISNLFGEAALSKAAMVLAFIMPLHNILSVIILTLSSHPGKTVEWKTIFSRVIKNPLIVSAAIAILFAVFKIPVHSIFKNTGNYLAGITLPLALLGIGGSLNIDEIKRASKMAFAASGIKLILLPLLGTLGAIWIGMRGQDLAVIFILFAAPTAIASFVMAQTMGANSRLAGNIVIISTFGAVLTITVGLYILKYYQLI